MKRLVFILLFFPGILFAQDKLVLDSLLVELKHSKEDKQKVEILWELSNYYQKSDLSVSLEYALEALGTAQRLEDSFLIASSYKVVGSAFLHMGNYNRALKNYLEGVKILEGLQNEVELFKFFLNLGVLHDRLEEYDKALEYFFEALSIYNKSKPEDKASNFNHIPVLYNNTGNIYEIKKEYDTALQYYIKAFDIASELNHHTYLGMICNNLGKLYTNLGKQDEAFHYLRLSLEHRKKINDLYGMAKTYILQGLYYLKDGNYEKALECAEKAKELSEKVGSKRASQDVAELFFEIYKAKKEYQKALDAYILYKQINESLLNEANQKEQVSLQLQYEFEKKEKEREAEHQKMRMRYLMLIAALIFVLLIVGLLYVLLKNRTRRTVLEKKNLEQELEINKHKLEAKNKELTTNVMYLLKKNEFMSNVTERLLNLKSRMKTENQNPLQSIIFDLQSATEKDVWAEFELRFENVHRDFFKKLKGKFPDLTPGDIKICAFLRLNMSSKEISAITHQSVKTIEVFRSRIRKKLDLTNTDVNLISFLNEF